VRCPAHKLTIWLLLVVHVLAGVSPAQRLVVCLEPDGGVVLETASPAGCSPCDRDEAGERGCGQDDVEGKSGSCACIDIPLPMRDEVPRLKVTDEPPVSVAPAPAAALVAVEPVSRFPVRACAASPPGTAPRLALVRVAVLRI
jgi:hypothetical protein